MTVRSSSGRSALRVGVRAPDTIVQKISYALEELLAAGRIPHCVERTETADGWDLFYGDRPPAGGALWMAAATSARSFFERAGARVNRVETAEVAGEVVRLPCWEGHRRPAGGPADHPEGPSSGRDPLPDLAAAAFFFLSRWEESQAAEQDQFGRFPLAASVFGRRLWSPTECPVETYARALRRVLEATPETASFVRRHEPSPWGGKAFAVGLSHDIDSLRRWDSRGLLRAGREVARALGRGRASAAARAGSELVAGLRARAGGQDPHWNLDAIVSLEQAGEAQSTFFLIPHHTHRWDGTHPAYYQRRLPSLAGELARMAEVGVHASTAAAEAIGDRGLETGDCGPAPLSQSPLPTPRSLGVAALRSERERLETMVGGPVRGVRFHNLRGGYEALPAVAAAGFEYDSTVGFAEEPGFRAGIARPFRPYDRERDRPVDLVEVPLVLMDTTLLSPRYLGLPAAAGRCRALAVLAALRQWGGAAALLWHNDNLPPNPAGGYAELYGELMEWTRAAGGRLCPLAAIVDDWKQAQRLMRE